MYLDYFGLKKEPFTISPDPAFLYPSARHRQALAHLKYGIEREGGFILLTGEVGTGKTTLTRLLLRQLPGNVRVAYILNARLGELDLMSSICQELGVSQDPYKTNIREYTDALNKDLLAAHAAGKKTLLVIEEAQNLDPAVLEMLRLLTNLETDTTKLLHILLVAQPELLEVIGRPELRQLNQRVVSRYHLEPLNLQETSSYLRHRMRRAGCTRPVFDQTAAAEIHRISGGVPRIINLLSERSLLGAYASEQASVSKQIAAKASNEVLGTGVRQESRDESGKRGLQFFGRSLMFAFVAILMVFGWYLGSPYFSEAESSVNADSQLDGEEMAVVDAQPETQPHVSGKILPNAYTSLLQLWSIDQVVTRQSDLCEVGAEVGLMCQIELSLNVERLSQKRRPGVIQLVETGDQAATYLLSSLGSEGFTLSNSRGEFQVSAEELASRWDGAYLYFWRAPPGYEGSLYVGGKNMPVVDWLQDKFLEWDQSYQEVITGGIYSGAISEHVKRFQADHGMESDGVLSPETIIALNDLSGGAPTLEGSL